MTVRKLTVILSYNFNGRTVRHDAYYLSQTGIKSTSASISSCYKPPTLIVPFAADLILGLTDKGKKQGLENI